MGRVRELPDPVDLPQHTKTVVKVQQPPADRGDNLHWIIFAREHKHFRLYLREQLPVWLIEVMGDRRKAYFNAEVRDGEWVFLSVAPDQHW